MRKLLILAATTVSTLANAAAMPSMPANPWSFSGAMGYSNTSNMIVNDGQTAFLRLALGRYLMDSSGFKIGAELGAQTGSNSRLDVSGTNYSNLGGVAVQTTITPMVDLLLTARKKLSESSKFSSYFKAGVAYRTMHFDRDTMNDLRKINPEVQVGVSMSLTSNACLSLGYQGVLSKNINLTTTTTGTGNVKNIPAVHGALMSVTYKA